MIKKVYLALILSLVLLISFSSMYILQSHSEPQKLKSEASNITIFLTGDVMLDFAVDPLLDSNVDVFGDLTPLFKMSDLVVINLEDPFTNSSNNLKTVVPVKADPEHAHILKDDNVNVACLANNHIMDYSESGLNDTLRTLETYNITTVGAGSNLQEASKPAYFVIDNRTIAILNFFDTTTFQEFSESELPPATANTSGFAPAEWSVIKENVDQAKTQADIVIVVFHYGNEYSTSPNEYQQNLSRKCIDEGADLVVGSHPHVLQNVESYKGKLIFYSLGNCVFDQTNPSPKESMVVKLQDLNGNLTAIIYPFRITNSCPRFMSTQNAETFLKTIKAQSNADIKIEDGKGIINLDIS
ncbi:MAG: CapA family protein [Methanobacterium sp.]|nr:CapA family protein [Methanobacterium sp.]